MTTFALVHGGSHGAWCWERLEPELTARGFGVVTMDLPMEQENAGAREWAQAVVDALEGIDDDVVVVCHSMSGIALPLVASMRPVRRMVFLAAMVPALDQVFFEYLATPEAAGAITMPMTDVEPDELGRGAQSWATARDYFYPDCTPEDADWAWRQLRGGAITVFTEKHPLAHWPDVPTTSIVMQDDKCVGPDWSRRVAARIGAEVVELPGGHSPFLADPARLADTLALIAVQDAPTVV